MRRRPPPSITARAARPATTLVTRAASGLYEVMEINDELRELILVGASALELKKKALEQGMITLRRSGLIKVAARADNDGRSRYAKQFCKDGGRNGWHYTERTTEEDDRNGRQRLAPFDQQRAARPRSRQTAAAGYASADGGGHQGAGL